MKVCIHVVQTLSGHTISGQRFLNKAGCNKLRPANKSSFRAQSTSALDEFLHRIEINIDKDKEAARSERRQAFTHVDWKRHRSSARFIRHLSTIPESWVIRGVLWHVACFILLALGVAAFNYSYACKGLVPPYSIAIEPMQLTSFALSLLLVFRTNASYARWQEARRSFGSITTTGKDIMRQSLAWFCEDDWAGKMALSGWLQALAQSSMYHLQNEGHLEDDSLVPLQGCLNPDELAQLRISSHKPTFCIAMITRLVSRAGMPTELLLRMDENISTLVQAVSSCERIINTPIPLSYTRHTSRFLMVWLTCLPFSLWQYCGWAMVPIAGLISFVLLGIEEIGVYIEVIIFFLLYLGQLSHNCSHIVK
ncbi:hypothetical protein CEUSTIGMA_g13614.t1, partial [Chlamydomonas eustigma]